MNCNSILLLADESSGFELLSNCLSEMDCIVQNKLLDEIDALNCGELGEYRALIMNVRALNALHHSILIAIQQQAPLPVVVFTKESDEESIMLAVNAGANSIVIDGIECRRVPGIMKIAQARFKRCMALREELNSAQQKLRERANVDRAKGILMSRKGMDEEQAYRFLRKMAMDNNQRLGDLASRFIEFESMLE